MITSTRNGTTASSASAVPIVFSRFDHALEIRTIAMPKSQPMNGTTSVTIAATSSLPGAALGLRRRLRGLDDLLRRPEPLEHVANRDLAGSVFFAQGRLDVLADLGDQLCAS